MFLKLKSLHYGGIWALSLFSVFNIRHSACTACLDTATAHIEAETACIKDATDHMEAAIICIGAETDHI